MSFRQLPTALAFASGVLLCGAAAGQIPEQYPKPLIHTAADHPAKHVVLVSVDGLHAADLAEFVAAHPRSTLAQLSSRGVTYTNAHAPLGDPAVGLLALVTGGTPISTGVISSDGYTPAGSRTAPRVNTIFEVAHNKVGGTAWAGKSEAEVALLQGPSGKGVDAPFVDSSDAARLDALLRAVASKDPPALFGLSYAGFDNAARSLEPLDAALARLVDALHKSSLDTATWVVITAPYADHRVTREPSRISLAAIESAIKPATAAHVSGGDIAMIWLTRHSDTPAAVHALDAKSASLGVADILSGERLALTFTRPAQDPRMPDIILEPAPGTLYGEALHGGLDDADTHVALLISGPQLTGRSDPTWVPTTQLAPLLLRAFGLEKFDLDALHREHTPALPGIF